MNESLLLIHELIHKEAEEIIFKKGLDNILKKFGTPHYTGSYALQLMTWRDLDIYLETESITIENFFVLGSRINELCKPVKMSFRNELIAQTEGLPKGLYWGVYLGDERNGAWKIDIWAINNEECTKRLNYCHTLSQKISDKARMIILDIKSQCWKDPYYRKAYTSSDIYQAVLEEGISNINEFRKWLVEKKLKKIR